MSDASVPLATPPLPPSLDPGVPAGADPTRAQRLLAYGLTWVSYASYYLGRKGISVTKSTIGADSLKGVETAYLAAYAIGQPLNGLIGDRIGARRLVGFGMLLSAAACGAFGASSVWLLFFLAFLVNGFAQSTGWPGNVKAMAEWTTPANRGGVMGIWTTCYQVGGLFATAIATWFLVRFGWRGAFHGPALWLAGMGLLILVFLRPGPGAVGGGRQAAQEALDESEADAAELRKQRRRVLASPTMWCYGLSYFGIKLIRYSILLWLPYYLTTVLHYSKGDAGYHSTSFEMGGIAGAIAFGFASDRLKRIPRAALAAASLVGLAGALYLYVQVGGLGPIANFLAMVLVGTLLFGPDTLIAGAATQDAGGRYAAATAAGMVNGIGSVGAILQELVTRQVSAKYGWGALFYVFVALALFSSACLLPTLRRR